MQRIKNLDSFALEILSNLPVEPTGLSLPELADGVLDNAGPQARSQVKHALEAVEAALGGLHLGRGDDDLGHADVRLYAVRRQDWDRVQRFFRKRAGAEDE